MRGTTTPHDILPDDTRVLAVPVRARVGVLGAGPARDVAVSVRNLDQVHVAVRAGQSAVDRMALRDPHNWHQMAWPATKERCRAPSAISTESPRVWPTCGGSANAGHRSAWLCRGVAAAWTGWNMHGSGR